ncbi:MAG: pantoate--beta-alanine ligase [Ignavibacteria bacterium RBG_13_36_8]|nr:MAG: pantoate--beta-alanine ligase [Ignavibacteria bacterium RBG_13_36_8]
MTRVIKNINEWRKIRKRIIGNKSLGFVPTMGALHEGHMSLIHKSKSENEITVVSIFINPTQFNNPEDLVNYPKTFNADLQKLTDAGVDYLFYPDYTELYPDNFKYEVNEKDLSKILCGTNRPGHFTGVLTVVMKLFNIIQADRAYFGEKDFQQYQLIKGMVDAFFLEIQIIPCPLIREPNGLAMSSRNVRLSTDERLMAPKFYQTMKSNSTDEEIKARLESEGFMVDYITTINNRRFGAVQLGKVRLIDNVEV